MAGREREVEELRRTVAHLGAALKRIDEDVARAARKYLKGGAGVLDFSEFLDLLVAEVKAACTDKTLVRAALEKLVRERLEQEVAAMLPTLKGRLSDYVTFPVVILPRSHDIRDHLLVKTAPFYRAMCVRGETSLRTVGPTPESAWQECRKRIVCQIFGGGPQETARQLSHRDWELEKKWDVAKPFAADEIEGFKVEVRLFPDGNTEA